MRRYAVRFLVAILTFGLGVALSLVFGLFSVRDTKTLYKLEGRRNCPKELRVLSGSPFLRIDTEQGDPVRLTYLGTTSDSHHPRGIQREFRIENTTGNTVVEYWIRGERIGQTNGSSTFDWSSNRVLRPGDSHKLTLPAESQELLLRVNQVVYQSGFSWVNPRGTR
jgi:hypothetical protein